MKFGKLFFGKKLYGYNMQIQRLGQFFYEIILFFYWKKTVLTSGYAYLSRIIFFRIMILFSEKLSKNIKIRENPLKIFFMVLKITLYNSQWVSFDTPNFLSLKILIFWDIMSFLQQIFFYHLCDVPLTNFAVLVIMDIFIKNILLFFLLNIP